MKKRKKYLPCIPVALISFGIVLYLIFFRYPRVDFNLSFVYLSPILLFFIFLSLGIFSAALIALTNLRRALLITCYIVGILLLRFFGFKSWVHISFLFIILVLIELFFSTR